MAYNQRSSDVRVARRFLISGRVQGVGFRYFVQTVASREQLAGWVRNLPDGHVEAFAEGPEEHLDRFEAQLRVGPPGSNVARVDRIDRADAVSERRPLTRFEIR